VFTLYFCNQFNSTLVKAVSDFFGLTEHWHPAQNTDEVWTAYLDTTIISDGFKEFNNALTKTKNPDKIKLRYFRRLPTQSWELVAKRKVQSVSKSAPINHGVLKTLKGVL